MTPKPPSGAYLLRLGSPLKPRASVPRRGEKVVTVGIGVLCEGGTTVVIASDTRGSYGPDNPVASHEQISKQFDFWPKFNLHTCVAGDGSICHSFVSELSENFRNEIPAAAKAQLEHFLHALRDSQWHTWEPIISHELKYQLAITRDEWISTKEMDTTVFRAGRGLIRRTGLPVHVILGGFLGQGRPLLLRMTGIDDIEEEVNCCAIGSGMVAATDHLNRRGQNVHMSLARSLLHISEALLRAKRKDIYVGTPSPYSIITANGSWRFPAACSLMGDWRRKYRNNSQALDSDKTANQQVRELLIPHLSPHARQSASQT